MRCVGDSCEGPILLDLLVSPSLRRSRVLCFFSLLSVVLAVSFGVNAQSLEAFEVVSIKARTGDRAVGGPSAPDRFVRADATLHDLIRFAFDVQEFQIEGGPDWIASSRFEVNAKAASVPAGSDGMRALVRRLLEDRFTLRARAEMRKMPSDGPLLTTALQEQQGLKLESVRGLVTVLLVESAELPTLD